VQIRAAAKLSQEEMGMTTLDAELGQARSVLQSLNQNLADAAADPSRGNITTLMAQIEAQKAVVAAAEAKVAVSQTLQEKYRNAMARAVQVQAAAGREMAAKGCTNLAGIDMGGGIDEYAV
jgi:DNA repair ATPase RecN